MDRGDGCDDGQPEPETAMGRPVTQPLERLEDASDVGRVDDRPGISHGQLAAAAHGAGANPDLAARQVVPDGVVDQVRDEPFGQHRITRDDSWLKRSVHPPATQAGSVQDVLGHRGQVHLLPHGESALVARQDEQRPDEVLGVIDRHANISAHGAQVPSRAIRITQHHVDRSPHDRQRGAQLMRSIGDEPLLALERRLESAEHLVECLGQLPELVPRPGRRHPRRQVVLGRGTGGRRDPVHRAQRPSGEDPAEDRG